MAEKQQKDDVGQMGFEQAIKELADIVSKIEQGQIPLQESLGQYEKGMTLIKRCREILQTAEKRIEKISSKQQLEEGGQESE